MQLFFTHLPDEHLEQATNHKQCIVGLPDEQLTVEEKHNKDVTFKVKHRTVAEGQFAEQAELAMCHWFK